MSLSLLPGIDSHETIDSHTGGFRGCNTPNTSLPSVNPAIFSYYVVESAMFSYHSVNSAIFCTIR